MKLENEIQQQKAFDNEYEKLVVNILFTASWAEAAAIQRLKPWGISTQQYNVLRILTGSVPNPLMLNDIAARMIDKNSNATRLVEKLRLKNFVERSINPTSRRQVDISITQKGLELLEAIDQTTNGWLDTFTTLSLQEVQILNNLLDKLRK